MHEGRETVDIKGGAAIGGVDMNVFTSLCYETNYPDGK